MRGKQFLNGAADRATMVDGCPLAPARSTATGLQVFGSSTAQMSERSIEHLRAIGDRMTAGETRFLTQGRYL